MRVALPALIPAFLICVSGSEALSSENALTGCLKNGRLTNLAIGDEPAMSCKRNETEISLPVGDGGETDGKTAPFFVTLDGDGSETTIAVNGSLELYARCELDLSIGQDQVSIIVSSETTGALVARFNDPTQTEFLLAFGRTEAGPGTEKYTAPQGASSAEGLSVLAPDGSYIGVEGSTLGFGLNILDHDCIAIGTAHLNNAPPE